MHWAFNQHRIKSTCARQDCDVCVIARDVDDKHGHVIAAAPELLKACEIVLMHIPPAILRTRTGDGKNVLEYLTAAVEKARGKKA